MLALKQLSLFLLLILSVSSQTTVAVTASNQNINTLATYTFTLTFDSAASRSNLIIYFPSQLSLTGSTTITQGGTLLNTTQYLLTNTTVQLSRTIINTTIIVTNVRNPSSAISTFDFTISTNTSTDSQPASIFNYITYNPGALQSCRYAFTGTTEQSNSTLTATIILNDPVTIGSNSITVGYPINWQYLTSKSMTSNNPVITCAYSINGSTTSTTLPCSYSTTSITLNLTLISPISANTTLQLTITGINCPPTVSTPTSTAYQIIVYDLNNAKIN
jgi:hypothetical protein